LPRRRECNGSTPGWRERRPGLQASVRGVERTLRLVLRDYYFHRFLGRNPFGFTALDLKAYYMRATGCSWIDTRSSRMAEALKPERKLNRQALNDAQYQVELFRLVRARACRG
jgi:hypothetical protein